MVVIKMSANVLGLCEEAELEAQMFNLAQMFIRIPNVQFSTEPAFSQNPCWWLAFFRLLIYRTFVIVKLLAIFVNNGFQVASSDCL